MQSVLDFGRFKTEGRRISVVTAYDASAARIVAASNVDAILVGDSVAMVVHGHPTTVTATVDLLAIHTRAVARGAGGKFQISDLPFLSYRKGLRVAMDAVETLMGSGAHAVKLEGVDGHEDVIRHIVGSGVPVMGHIGLTPQSVHQLGGFRVQGKDPSGARRLMEAAHALEAAGCYALVLEGIPSELAADITAQLAIPTVGIGAGPGCDGQVLVCYDLLGMNPAFAPKFVKAYEQLHARIGAAVSAFGEE